MGDNEATAAAFAKMAAATGGEAKQLKSADDLLDVVCMQALAQVRLNARLRLSSHSPPRFTHPTSFFASSASPAAGVPLIAWALAGWGFRAGRAVSGQVHGILLRLLNLVASTPRPPVARPKLLYYIPSATTADHSPHLSPPSPLALLSGWGHSLPCPLRSLRMGNVSARHDS